MLPKTVFTDHGVPFFPLGAQSHNSSGYSEAELRPFWDVCEKLPLNSVAIPIAWERIEPVEGQFDLEIVKSIISACRERNLKLILPWFGTWKNGHMKYVPQWVKCDRERFPRVVAANGAELPNLSAMSVQARDADKRAFCRMMETIRDFDREEQTVIAVQVENELGIIGQAIRDHSPAAQAAYAADVPPELLARLEKAEETEFVVRAWRDAGAKTGGSWESLLGNYAPEAFTAYHMAKYIEDIARAGKQIYDVPMYTNAWLDGQGFDTPGVSYPSGGVVMKNIAIWKWFAPSLDMLCPDIYAASGASYREIATAYSRDDNPLFVPETGFTLPSCLWVFRAIEENALTGIHFFGAESIADGKGGVRSEALPIVDNYQALSAVLPLLTRLRGTGKIHAVVQEEFMHVQRLRLDGYQAIAQFGEFERGGDFRHMVANEPIRRGRGLVIQTGPKELVVCGMGFTLKVRPLPQLGQVLPEQVDAQPEHHMEYPLVEEGRFDSGGTFCVERVRNGDQTDFGIYVYPDCAVRVVLP